ncbi:hypothetical protein KI387_006332, partial [Taxus chinensis]
ADIYKDKMEKLCVSHEEVIKCIQTQLNEALAEKEELKKELSIMKSKVASFHEILENINKMLGKQKVHGDRTCLGFIEDSCNIEKNEGESSQGSNVEMQSSKGDSLRNSSHGRSSIRQPNAFRHVVFHGNFYKCGAYGHKANMCSPEVEKEKDCKEKIQEHHSERQKEENKEGKRYRVE